MHKSRGVEFSLKRKFIRFDSEEDKITKVNVKGKSFDTDYVVMFPNNEMAQTNFIIDDEQMFDEMKFDRKSRVLTHFNQNSGAERVFMAGDPSAMLFFATMERIPRSKLHKRVNEGVNAAYNVMGLVSFN